jgi:hypothetical protein
MNNKYYLTLESPDTPIVDLSKVVGVIEIIQTPNGMVADEMLKSGNFHISPYGVGEKDEDGNITKFELTGFSILPGGVNKK